MRGFAAAAAAGLAVACAGPPRAFQPVLLGQPGDAAGFRAALIDCAARVEGAQGLLAGPGRSAGAGVVAAGAGVAAGEAVAGGATGDWADFTVGATAILVAPLLLYGLSAARRHAEERRIQNEMEACLAEDGYEVAYWRRRDVR